MHTGNWALGVPLHMLNYKCTGCLFNHAQLLIALERFLSVTKTSEPFLDLIKRNYSSVVWHASLFVG